MFPKINDFLFTHVENEVDSEYRSRVADIRGKEIIVEIPIDVKTGKVKTLYRGENISFSFIDNEGIQHFFESKVLGFMLEKEHMRQVMIEKPALDQITRKQRRSFLRMPASLECKFKINNNGLDRQCFTHDISGGGMCFIYEDDVLLFPEQTIQGNIYIMYKNKDKVKITFEGELVRQEPEKNLIKNMVKFTKISEQDRQHVVKFCIERQLELYKKM
ncbi:flagellar brake protein [Longirhabdus pacifica]|uniref:flagellar brake protein n=1 Tax=Longirhabdus pacifica TaxID=2305227 RepID=UPI0013E8B8BD|nr:PilZ domain-containing protein [Longirhabdus pacifica]